jgi:hypothetical protein
MSPNHQELTFNVHITRVQLRCDDDAQYSTVSPHYFEVSRLIAGTEDYVCFFMTRG